MSHIFITNVKPSVPLKHHVAHEALTGYITIMEQQAVFTIGGIALPLGLTAAEMVDQVTNQVKLSPIHFSFNYRQVGFTCTCEDQSDGTVLVALAGRLGVVPFTAESNAARRAVTTIADYAHRDLKGCVSVRNGYVTAHYQTVLQKPISATSIISSLIVFLVSLNPYIALLGEVIDLPLAQKARKSAVRPRWRDTKAPAKSK